MQYMRGGEATSCGHKIGCISTQFTNNYMIFQQEPKFDIKLNKLGNETHLVVTK